jgi:peptidoglycan lytic transglycosylase F
VVGTEKKLVWLLPPGETALAGRLQEWMAAYRATGELARLQNRYYGHLNQFDPYDVAVFTRRVEERLPRYQSQFEDASRVTSLPWTTLAAMSYQESQWDPSATSVTGVRGIMMLTEVTADALGVSDRLDPMESILAGAEYLRQRMDLIPSWVPEPDRLWMGLAAYNVGQRHLQDARMLAIRLGENPNTWAGVKATLPRLAQRQYYQDLPAGYARGLEPVIYVERVRHYQDILEDLVGTRDVLE